MDVHLRDLRYFLAVAEELHFGRAAERLFICHPALSKQIRRLERSLRHELFERDRRTVALAAAGEALLPRALELVRAWDDAQLAIADAAAREVATLTVGLVTSVGRDILPATSRRFADRRPASRFELRQVAWQDPTGLASGESDVAFVWLPLPDDESFACEPLLRNRGGSRCRPTIGSPRATRSPSRSCSTNRSRAPVQRRSSTRVLARRRRAWRAAGSVAAEVTSADATFEAIAGGVGVALVTAGNAELYRRQGVIIRPVAAPAGRGAARG